MLDEKSPKYWNQFPKSDWENPKGCAVAAFVRLRYEQKATGIIQLAKKACETAGADFNEFTRNATNAVDSALYDDKKRTKSNNCQASVQNVDNTKSANLLRLGSIVPREMRYLWKPFFPLGSMTIVQGDPGCGKTHFAAWLAAMVTKGGRAPDGSDIEQGSVIFQSTEDGVAEGLVPRLVAAGANMDKVFCFDENSTPLFVQDLRRI
jgi:hypothetical protein